MGKKINVTIWNEYTHERHNDEIRAIYPKGIHGAIGEALESDEISVTLAALDDPDNGLPESVLASTDVLMWWGHMRHHEVPDALVQRISDRVICEGMGFIALHSAHKSKPFNAIVGGNGNLLWGDDQKEVVWNVLPSHPIAEGIPEHFILETEEMYGEPFMIPQPDENVFISWFEHGNVFRSGCCFYRGLGKIFYFQPGHESCRSFYDDNVIRILRNAVKWAAPGEFRCRYPSSCDYFKPLI